MESPNPMPGIRAVIWTGFLTSNVAAIIPLVARGHWRDLIELLPDELPTLLGAVLGIGTLGMVIGTIIGLSLRLLVESEAENRGWGAPLIAAGIVSTLTGLAVGQGLTALF